MAKLADGLIKGEDGKVRCWWPGAHADYLRYHDTNWGHPVRNDIKLFEKLTLEGFQSGLSWLTILRKRAGFRAAFAGFDFEEVATFGARDVTRLLKDEGIVRHRGKIEATINNAKRAIEMVDEYGSLYRYFWSYEPSADERPKKFTKFELMKLGKTPTSIRLSKDLKKRGWKFVGPTTVYAFMQTSGIVNDHIQGCACRAIVETKRKKFRRPKSIFE